jgi:hypothetical protein
MSRILKSRRAKVLVGVIATMAVAAVAAFAFLAVTGTGSGTGSVTASDAAVKLTADSPTLLNIGDTKTVNVYAANKSTSPEKISAFTASAAVAAAVTGCPVGSFSVTSTDPIATADQPELPASDGTAYGTPVKVGTITVKFNDDATHAQNGCQGTDTVALTLNATSGL